VDKCEPDGAFAALVPEFRGAVEFDADVARDIGVEVVFRLREFVTDGARDPFREEPRAVEIQELLLHEPAYHVGGVGGLGAVAGLALEPVVVEQRHEEVEVRIGVHLLHHQMQTQPPPVVQRFDLHEDILVAHACTNS
jgi:hypothetical protein